LSTEKKINVTNLCKDGGKQFNHWKSIIRTGAFLQALSSTTGIPVVDLIKKQTGGNPQVAINIAQWISPIFDVKVSAWTCEVKLILRVSRVINNFMLKIRSKILKFSI
jgi:hypothetical protein